MRILALVLVLAQAMAVPPAARPGWDHLDAGRPREAAAAFEEALRRTPQEPVLLVGAALAAHLLGRSDEARRYLVDALRIAPALTPASVLLGEVLYRTGDLDGAIATYQQALAHAPEHPQITAKLEAWRKEAALHDRFGRKLGDHFTVLFEGPAEAALAQKAVEILDAAYWRIGTALFTYPAEVITVVLYTREQFRDITQLPDWAAGAFAGRIRVPVRGALENPAEFERVLAHEFTHALVRSLVARGLPRWLDEGIAMHFEPGAPPPRARPGLPLTKLEGSFAGLPSADARQAYDQSAAAVAFLFERAGAPAVVNVLSDVGTGVPFARAFERHVHMSYEAFQAEWAALIEQSRE